MIGGFPQRILLIDDEPAIGRLLQMLLHTRGMVVDTVVDVDAAREMMLNRRYSIVLSDVLLPYGGVEDVRQMADLLQPGVPILYMSGYSRDVLKQSNRLPESAHFIQKPFNFDSLLNAMDALLVSPRVCA